MKNNILIKLAKARGHVKATKMKKAGSNKFSGYDYFTPEQVERLVYEAEMAAGLISIFRMNREADGITAILAICDVDSDAMIDVSMPVEIPQIKATNEMQKLGGAMTYCERYLKMSAYGIADNNLDFDTTENTKREQAQKAAAQQSRKQPVKKPLEIVLPDNSGPTAEWDNILKGIATNKIQTLADVEAFYLVSPEVAKQIENQLKTRK